MAKFNVKLAAWIFVQTTSVSVTIFYLAHIQIVFHREKKKRIMQYANNEKKSVEFNTINEVREYNRKQQQCGEKTACQMSFIMESFSANECN